MSELKLSCDCGAVTGKIVNASGSSGNRVVCCCSDCQAFARYLKTEDKILDSFGGTQLYQTSQSQVRITTGENQLQCVRLAPKGLARWHTLCCNTAVANTLNAKMPFAGIISSFWHTNSSTNDSSTKNSAADEILGPVLAFVQTQHAIGNPDYPKHSAKFPLSFTLRVIPQMLAWKLRGKHQPSVFYNSNGKPVTKPIIINAD